MRILITGATGLIGKEIVRICHLQNIDINYLTTHKSKIVQQENYKGFYWNPALNHIDKACFNGVDAIIHLAGASISKRWTTSYKKEIISSRVDTTKLLIHTLRGCTHSVKHVVSSSGIGVYPYSLTKYYDETFKTTSDSFLGDVVKKWEASVDGFSELNIKVSKIRTGIVLSSKGGALPEMTKPIKYGVGAAFGDGKHWQSWIHITDLSHMFLYVIKHQLDGIYNGVSPNPETNQFLTKTIANVLNKPLILPNIPRFMMKFILGEMYLLLFDSQRVSSKKIEDQGFVFEYHHSKTALQNLLG